MQCISENAFGLSAFEIIHYMCLFQSSDYLAAQVPVSHLLTHSFFFSFNSVSEWAVVMAAL